MCFNAIQENKISQKFPNLQYIVNTTYKVLRMRLQENVCLGSKQVVHKFKNFEINYILSRQRPRALTWIQNWSTTECQA